MASAHARVLGTRLRHRSRRARRPEGRARWYSFALCPVAWASGARWAAGRASTGKVSAAQSTAQSAAPGRGLQPDRPLGARVRARSDPRPPSPEPARLTADRDCSFPVCSQLHVVFYFVMSGQPHIYHATTEYRRGSQGLLRGFAEPRSFYGPAGPLVPRPQQRGDNVRWIQRG